MTEESMLIQLKAGSADALAWFVGKYTLYVSTVVYNIIGTHMSFADVEEVTSDVFWILWKKADTVKDGMVRGFLGCVARNRAKNKFRDAGFEIVLDDEFLISEDTSPEDLYLESELQLAVRREVMGLSEPDREIVLRFYYYFQSVSDIASALGMTESNVKVRLHRCRKLLKRLLETDIVE